MDYVDKIMKTNLLCHTLEKLEPCKLAKNVFPKKKTKLESLI